jgi:hypothetical protein
MERKSFLLRIDPALWAELESWAQDELRSINGQIEFVLRQAVQKRKGARQKPSTPTAASEASPNES